MTQRDESDGLAVWLTLGALVVYWWFMARAVMSLLRSLVELGRWFGDWREEDRAMSDEALN